MATSQQAVQIVFHAPPAKAQLTAGASCSQCILLVQKSTEPAMDVFSPPRVAICRRQSRKVPPAQQMPYITN